MSSYEKQVDQRVKRLHRYFFGGGGGSSKRYSSYYPSYHYPVHNTQYHSSSSDFGSNVGLSETASRYNPDLGKYM